MQTRTNLSVIGVSALSLLLLTGISLVPSLWMTASAQQAVGISQIIKQISQQVSTANPGINPTHVQQILVQLAKETSQTASQEQAIQEIRQISSQITTSPFGSVSQSLSHFAQQ